MEDWEGRSVVQYIPRMYEAPNLLPNDDKN